jgi:hypothetical protein
VTFGRDAARPDVARVRRWSGARDLNPGPHGPEPSWFHVLEFPGGSADARLNSNCHSLVTVRVLLEPPAAGNLWVRL